MKVNTFLEKAKKLISEGKFEFIERKENIITKRKYGLTTEDLEEMIKILKPADLIKGPVMDDFITSEDVWIFKKKYDGIEFKIYIKLKIRDNKKCICLSFHDDKD